MPRIVKCGLIQATHACSTAESLDTIREANIAKHLAMIEQAGREGVQILCMQEIFNGPYFCAEQSAQWYDAVGADPGRPDDASSCRTSPRSYDMAIVVPLYEEDGAGVYYNTAAVIDADGSYLGKYRKNHIPHCAPGFWEKFYFRPGNLGYPGVQDPVRQRRRLHLLRPPLPRGRARARASTARRSCSTRRPRWPGCPSISGSSSSRRTPWPTATSSARSTASGYEEPWHIGEFYGQSYFCDPRGQIVARGQARSGRAGDGGAGPRPDPRGAERVAVLPRPAAGDVRGVVQAIAPEHRTTVRCPRSRGPDAPG